MKLDEDSIYWHFEVWAWLIENFGGFREFRKTQLTPIDLGLLSIGPHDKHDKFAKLFDSIKSSMGISNWPCELRALESDKELQEFFQEREERRKIEGDYSTSDAAGLFQMDGDGNALIHYSRTQAESPAALVSTMVHELCHYLLLTAKSEPPGGWKDHEFHTDVAVIFSGFGIFQCNSAFEFKQWGDIQMAGWGYSRLGYLPETDLAYSFGIFLTLLEIDPKSVLKVLKRNPRGYLKWALKDLKKRNDVLDEIRGLRQV